MGTIYYHQIFSKLKKHLYLILGTAMSLGIIAFVMKEQTEEKKKPFVSTSEAPKEHIFVNAKSFELPKKLFFAGERVPLQDTDVRERLDKELNVNVYYHSSTIFLIKRANRWFPFVAKQLEKHNIPTDMIYLPLIESGFQQVVSPAGASGFWQLMKGTARELNLEVNDEVDERYHPEKSTLAAIEYLKDAYSKFGNWTNVAASYNMGMNGLGKALKKQRVNSYYDLLLNDETKRYVFRMLALREIMSNQKKYGFYVNSEELYYPEAVKSVEVKTNVPDLTEFAIQNGVTYKTLKRYNPWLRKNSLTIKKKGKTYQVLLPKNV